MNSFSYGKILVLGIGFLGITLLLSLYNVYVPILLQAGRADFSTSAGVSGYGLNTALAGFIMTLDNLAALVILPYVGAWSDRTRTKWGRRKPFIAIGAPIGALGFILLPLALGGPLIFFMGAIIINLLGMDFFRTPLVALMPDITPSPLRSQANGIIVLMGCIGGALAFFVGSKLFAVSPGAPFYFGAFAMLFCCYFMLAFVKEPSMEEIDRLSPADEEPKMLDSLLQVWRDGDRSALLLLTAIFFLSLSYSALEVFFSSYAVNVLQLDSGQAMGMLVYLAVALFVAAIPAGFIGARLGRRFSILMGIAAMALILIGAYFAREMGTIRLFLILIGLFWSLIVVNALPMVMDCAPPQRVGAYTGLYYLATQAAAIFSPILAGQAIALFNNDYRIMFLYGAASMISAFVFMLRVRRGEANSAPATANTLTHLQPRD